VKKLVGGTTDPLRYVHCVQESWRFTHNRDLVPVWPPQWVGFHHLPREVWQVDVDGAGVSRAVALTLLKLLRNGQLAGPLLLQAP
jgi:hypothetical protein